ncbi:MAG: hypothetical protein HY336_02720, partial [Candidatus Doudnabacteria bacterium]|nr:hypothetical protein [Candidatus Doudnabacteria bacterium]
VDSYETGSFVAPVNGTMITGEADKTVYLIDAGLKRPISYEIFVARKFSFAKLMKLTDAEAAGIPSGAFVYPPESVSLSLKGDTGIFWFKNGQKQFVSAFVFKQRGVGNFPRLAIGAEEFNQIPTGPPFPPKDGTIIKGDQSTAIYKVENGMLRMFTATSYKKARYPKATVLSQAEVDAFEKGSVIN